MISRAALLIWIICLMIPASSFADDSQDDETHILTIRVTGECWLQVSGPEGKIFQGLLRDGDEKNFGPSTHFIVTVGRPEKIVVIFDGEQIYGGDKPRPEKMTFALPEGASLEALNIEWTVARLGDRDFEVRDKAAEELIEIGEPAVPYLIDGLSDDEWRVRTYSAETLGQMGEDAFDAVPALIATLSDEWVNVKEGAAKAFVTLGYTGTDAVDALVLSLNDEESTVRGSAAWALGEIGADPDRIVPLLIDALGDEHWWVGDRASYALVQYGQDAVDGLLDAFDEIELSSTRWNAIYTLGLCGPEADEAVPLLTNLLTDDDASIRAISADTLGKLGGRADSAIPDLIIALDDDDEWVRSAAAGALSTRGKKASPARKKLLEILDEDTNSEARKWSAITLGEIGPKWGVIPALVAALNDDDVMVRNAAELAITTIGIPEILKLDLKTADPLKILSAALEHEDREIRMDAAFALGEYRSDANAYLGSLKKLASNRKDDEERWFLLDAIHKIENPDYEEEDGVL